MARPGIFLLIMGIGSLILPVTGRQFVLMSLPTATLTAPFGRSRSA